MDGWTNVAMKCNDRNDRNGTNGRNDQRKQFSVFVQLWIGGAQLRDLLVPGICNGLGAAFAGLYPGRLHLCLWHFFIGSCIPLSCDAFQGRFSLALPVEYCLMFIVMKC